ncbi:MAG: GIY-YIG nuclease family protein [Bacillota bacterium]|nr:GIY-YIG nuclease family protein [Bacillota bacterium]
MTGKYYVYILRCADGSLYTGITNDLERRLKMHNEKKASKYTRGRTPVSLVYVEEDHDKSSALKREIQIKKLTREKKDQLIKNQNKNGETL